MIPSDKELIMNFLAGGLLAVFFIFFLNAFKERAAAQITGFMYGAPLLLPYFAICVYLYIGSDGMVNFSRHTLLGLSFTIPILLAILCVKKKHYGMLLGTSIVYLIVIVSVYFVVLKDQISLS